MSKGTRALCCVIVLLASSAHAATWEIPFLVEEHAGQNVQTHVSGGIPLLPAQAKDTSELRIAVKKGGQLVAVPAQFRVLARWWRDDNSIRWVLVDFDTRVPPTHKRTFYLTNTKLTVPEPRHKLTVTTTADAITVTTGPARFVISRKNFTFLDHAYIDANKDGRFTANEDVLSTTPDCGTIVEDTYGETYYSSEQTKSVDVIDAGPMRVQLRAKGRHRARDGKGYSQGMYGYDVFLNFYAGSADVNADVIVTNNPPKSIGSPTFEDASLLLKMRGGASGFRIYGQTGLDGGLGQGESVRLYQDSNGAETWQKCQGYTGPQSGPGGRSFRGKISRFRGYRITKRSGGKDTAIGSGDHARGLVHAWNQGTSMIVHTRNFWQQFPKAVEVSSDGTVRVGLFPREYSCVHYLEDASAKGHEIILRFHNHQVSGNRRHWWPNVLADAYDYPLHPRPALKHLAATGALTDVGPFTVPVTGFTGPGPQTNRNRMFRDEQYYGNGYGWQIFGSRWRVHGGHSHRGARQPMNFDNFLYRWYMTGRYDWLVLGKDRSRHFRDVRQYRIEEQDPFSFNDWKSFSRANVSEDWTKRPQPTNDEYKKYTQGYWKRGAWSLPDPAHMTLDLLYDRYLLFGDVRALENMKVVAGHGVLSASRRPHVHRMTGWSWRAPERYWELTGDPAARKLLDAIIKNFRPLIGKTPLVAAGREGVGWDRGLYFKPGETPRTQPNADDRKVNWWFTQIFTRAAAITALHTGDKQALELCKTLAVGKENRARYYCTLYAVLYHFTGEKKYKDLVLRGDNGAGMLTVVMPGDFPATAYWLFHQVPRTGVK